MANAISGPIDHVSVLITDVAAAREFYGRILGLREIAKPKTFDFVALWYALGSGQTLHLLQKPQADTRSPRHFALRVEDAHAARAYFRSEGVAIQETGPIPGCDRLYEPAASGAARLD
jgi:catechol 2,3-dioxygenase-like lactoylglutathione lyase family enzyme